MTGEMGSVLERRDGAGSVVVLMVDDVHAARDPVSTWRFGARERGLDIEQGHDEGEGEADPRDLRQKPSIAPAGAFE